MNHAPNDHKVESIVPEGSSGSWRVRRVDITAEQAALANVKCPWRPTAPGRFTELLHGGQLVMVDSHIEYRDHFPLRIHARGRVLLHGLGLGMAAKLCLDKPEVEHVLVVERSPDVIALVAPHYERAYPGRIAVVQADALTWRPPASARWDAVWHDIWPDISRKNLPEMHLLHRRFGRRAKWQGSWARWECENRV